VTKSPSWPATSTGWRWSSTLPASSAMDEPEERPGASPARCQTQPVAASTPPAVVPRSGRKGKNRDAQRGLTRAIRHAWSAPRGMVPLLALCLFAAALLAPRSGALEPPADAASPFSDLRRRWETLTGALEAESAPLGLGVAAAMEIERSVIQDSAMVLLASSDCELPANARDTEPGFYGFSGRVCWWPIHGSRA